MSDGENKPKSKFIRFLSNPIVGFVSIVLSLSLAIYGIHTSHERPSLTYLINPVKTSILSRSTSSRLTVKYDSVDVSGDITAVQIAIWNAGNKSIHKENILIPLMLSTIDHSRILDVSIRKTSRDIIGLQLDKSKLDSGILKISWKILEPRDGFSLQLIVGSNEHVELSIISTIEGQRTVVNSAKRLQDFYARDNSPKNQKPPSLSRYYFRIGGSRWAPKGIVIVFLLCIVIGIILFIDLIKRFKRNSETRERIRNKDPNIAFEDIRDSSIIAFVLQVVFLIITICYFAVSIFSLSIIVPPFGF
jgi:hypothetical protein